MATRTCRIGLHGRNSPTFEEIDYQVIRTAKIETLKMMGLTKPAVFRRLQKENPGIELITRLYDDRFRANAHPTPQQFAQKQIPIMRTLRPYCTKFEIHNEPNHLAGYEGWGQEDYHAQDFNAWFLETYRLLKQACPWASLGFPGLAIPHRDLEWIDICRPAIERADWLGVHCYWQTPPGQPNNHLSKFWGGRFQYYHQKFPTKIIEITECGNSNNQAEPPISTSDNDLAQQTVQYFQEVFKYPYINSASFFLLSSPDSRWDFFSWRAENRQVKPVVSQVGKLGRPALVTARPSAGLRPDSVLDAGTSISLGGGQTLPAIQVLNIADSLTHGPGSYPSRALSQIKQIIIHHTAVSEKVGPVRIAKLQVERGGKPGIAYHYFVTENGTIYQTNALTTVPAHTAGYDQTGVAVVFAGNFTTATPTPSQLQAGGVLCASLMLQLNIKSQAVKGASELIATESPGRQWLDGARWKLQLLAQIRQAQGGTSTGEVAPPAQPAVFTGDTLALKTQLAELSAKLAQVQSAYTAAQQKIIRLQAELAQAGGGGDSGVDVAALKERIATLELQLSIARQAAGLPPVDATGGTSTAHAEIPPPPITNIATRLAHHATKRYATRPESDIRQVVIHHTGLPPKFGPEQIAEFYVSKNGWPGIGVHYFIAQDGAIYQTNEHTTVSYHAGEANNTSLGVTFAGEFNNLVPASAQIQQGAHLIAWLLRRLNLPASAVVGHKAVDDTPCPGKQWDHGQNWQQLLLQAIQRHLAGQMTATGAPIATRYHFLVLGGQADMDSAARYIAKFQPQVGFSATEGLGFRYVTLVGNVPASAEAQLQAGGSQVERLPGNTPAAIKSLLDNLARTNRRFLTLQGE